MPIRLLPLALLGLLLLAAQPAAAQISIAAPTPSRVASCDDFATMQFGDPWDMSNTADVNNYFPGNDIIDFADYGFANGRFMGRTTGANNTLYLFSPVACGGHPSGGRYGQDFHLDTNKYTRLSLRMYVDKVDPHGMRIMFNRGCNYVSNRSVSKLIPIRTGWHTYTIDLNTLEIEPDSDIRPWSAGSITGLALRPTTQTDAVVMIDWVRLEDPNSCNAQSVTTNYSTSPLGNNDLYSLYLDDNANPFDGYLQQIVSAAPAGSGGDTILPTPIGLAPGTYRYVGILDSDYATLELTNPWDMNDADDIQVYSGITNPTFANGTFSGTLAMPSAQIYLKVGDHGIDANKYTKISVRITKQDTSDLRIFYPNGTALLKHVGGDVYQADLTSANALDWFGTLGSLILSLEGAGSSFSLDFVALRKSGYVTSHEVDSIVAGAALSSGALELNHPPIISIDEPNMKGGVGLRPWNMNEGDFHIFSNLTADPDPAHPGENTTSWLPDVRLVDGLRGDFFKGTNVVGSDDPVNYSTTPFGVDNPIQFSADEYPNLCFKLYMDVPFILDAEHGSMARVVWKELGSDVYESGGAYVLVYDGWSGSRWNEYCDDLRTLEPDTVINGSTWNGIIQEFRVDAHEIPTSAPYYFDYIKLRKDDHSTNGKFRIIYRLSDPDLSDKPTLSLYYHTVASTSGGTLIASGLPATSANYLWDTSAVPNGAYYIYAVATDGLNEVRRLASGKILVANNGSNATHAPVLSLERPAAHVPVCDAMQLKGYALQADRFEDVASVELKVNGALVDVLFPALYSPNAKRDYPAADSSNTGFNRSYDTSGWPLGANTVEVTAYSTDGGSTTQTITVTKQAAGCPDPIIDPDPAGVPAAVNVDAGNSEPSLPPPAINKVKHDDKGLLTFTVLRPGGEGCDLEVYAGDKRDGEFLLGRIFQMTAAEGKSGKMQLQSKKIRIQKKRFRKPFLQVIRNCAGERSSTSDPKVIKVKTTRGKIKTAQHLANAFSARLVTPKRKKNKNKMK